MTTTLSHPPAVILLSGGLDSATVAAMAKAQGFALHALSFAYGQRHKIELEYARKVAQAMGVAKHHIIALDSLGQLGGSSLTDATQTIPKDRGHSEMGASIPSTYVPARNTLFLSYALAFAEVFGAKDIFIGVNALDYSGYPDCRPEYIAAFERMANLATKAGTQGRHLTIHTPLIHMTKAEIIRAGRALGVNYDDTISCYDPTPNGSPCGHCDSCILRAKGFTEA